MKRHCALAMMSGSWNRSALSSRSRPPFDARLLLTCLLVAVACFAAGRLGQLLAAPPTYPTAIWPPSGIALAAILLIGPRCWPGIFLGAVFVNGWTPISGAETIAEATQVVFSPLSISVGSTLQALFGGWLIRRIVGFPNPLIHDGQILAFLALGGPVACLVGATWGVGTLAVAGAVNSTAQLALNWWTWWVGDVIGVVIFAPLSLICFARPRNVWRPRWASVTVPLVGAITVTVFGYMLTQWLDKRRAKAQFERIAGNSHQLLETEVARHIGLLDSLQRFFDNSQFINRAEFANFNRDNQDRFPAAQMVAWLPREVTSEEASANQVDRSGPEGPEAAPPVVDVIPEPGQATPLPETTPEADFTGRESFKAAYIYPAQTQFLSVGDDFAAIPNWHELMRRSCDTASQVASVPFLADGASGDESVLVLVPVYDRNSTPRTPSQRRQQLRGYLVGAFDVNTLVQLARPSRDFGMFRLDVDDVTDRDDVKLVHAAAETNSPHKASEVVPLLKVRYDVQPTVRIANRSWLCRYGPTTQFYTLQAGRHRWVILASGLALTGLLGAFLLILSGRTARIEASESRYLDLYENAPDMFISLDVGTQRVIECNRTFLEVSGYAKHDVIDKHIYALFAEESQTEARRAFRSFLVSGHVSDIELRLPCREDNVVDISMKMSAVRDESGQSVTCRAALRDITARKKVEADLKTQEREVAHVARLSMMGEMAAGLAHEINQPLGAIAAYAEGAAIRLRDGQADAKSLTGVLDRIARDAHRAGQVIRRLRQFLRKRTPEKTNININELVREVAQFVDSDLKRRSVRLGIELGSDLPALQGDPIQIQQVLLNLVRNGCDAMNDTEASRRYLMIRTRSLDGETVDVVVEDCGHGLANSANDQLFDAFFSTKNEGIGLGLAISRSIIESHGGEIWATSNLEGGASFHFSLPANAEICA